MEIASRNRALSQIGLIIGLLFFFILSFIRWETGTDWESYIQMYNWIQTPWEEMDSGMEMGFNIVNHLGKMLFDSYTGVLFLFAIVLYGFTYWSISYFSRFPITTLLLLFCLVFANIFFVRQNVALSILLVALIFAKQRRWWMFLLFVFFAAQFHRTSWIFLLAYPVFGRYYETRTLLVMLVISIIGSLVLSKVLISFVGNLGLGIVSKKIEMYLEAGADDNTMTFSTTTVLIKGIANRLFLLGLFFLFFHQKRKEDHTLNGLLNLYVLGTILYCATLPISISLARIAVYMDMIQIFIVPYLFLTQRTLLGRMILFVLIFVYYLIRFYSSFASFEYEYTPFVTIFD